MTTTEKLTTAVTAMDLLEDARAAFDSLKQSLEKETALMGDLVGVLQVSKADAVVMLTADNAAIANIQSAGRAKLTATEHLTTVVTAMDRLESVRVVLDSLKLSLQEEEALKSEPVSKLSKLSISKADIAALARENIVTIKDLQLAGRRRLLFLPGFGRKRVNKIAGAFAASGLAFR